MNLNTAISTTMGLKYPLKKFDSQWPFPMGIWNDFITIFGKDCHIWIIQFRSCIYHELYLGMLLGDTA